MEDRIANDADTRRQRAVARIPGGLFVMTAHCEGRRGAVPVKWVQQCADSPPMVMVALQKGLPIEPMVRDSRSFALCQISADDRFLLRKFGNGADHGEDPLVALLTSSAPSGSPILDRALTYLDCEIVRHVELDCDFRIYVAQVNAGAILNDGLPAISFGGNGACGAPSAHREQP
jgi:flavin reductase (DIM6/NTAB) family NADH-FMN oxidoreductase RutF